MVDAASAQDHRTHLRMRWAAAALVVGALLLAAFGLGELRFNTHYSAYFDPDDPLRRQHQEILDTYNRGDDALLILESLDGNFLDHENYILLEDLSAELADLPGINSVISLAELGINGEQEFADGTIAPSRAQLLEHDRAYGLLISDDARFAVIRVTVELDDFGARSVVAAMDQLRASAAARLEGHAVAVHMSGTLALGEAYVSVVRHDLKIILPALLVIMAVALAVLLGGPASLFVMMPIGALSVVAAFGLAGLIGTELVAINAFIPVIILSISLAGCVHVILRFQTLRRRGVVAASAALRALRDNLLPMSLANATTIVGFLGLALSPSPPVRNVGFLVAAGISLSFLLCVTLLPSLLARLDPIGNRAGALSVPALSLARLGMSRHKSVFVSFALLTVASAWLVLDNEISDDVFEYFPDSHSYHIDTRVVADNLSGVNEVLYSIDAGAADALFNVHAIRDLEAYVAWLRAQPEVIQVTSIAENESLREADRDGRLEERLQNYRRFLDDAGRIDRLVYHEITRDFSATLVAAYLRQLNSSEMIAFEERRKVWTDANLSGYAVTAGGASLMFANLGQKNVRSMIVALSAGLLVAALIFGIVFRSIRIALTGLVCNLFPIIFVYGIWALVGGTLSLGAAVVMGMVLGIVIDDTVYLLAAFQRRRQRASASAVEDGVKTVGPALLVTTLTLVTGLGIGLSSDFGPIWSMAILSIAIISVALLADFLLMPALLGARSLTSKRGNS